MKELEICEKVKCTGCSACAQICPRQCITMLPDLEGFLRPNIDIDACIKCEKCQKICPLNTQFKDEGILPQTFGARHIDDEILKASSSGGVFSALAEYVIRLNGAVFAAGFDNEFRVIHKACTNTESLDELRRSKYVQSDVNGTFIEAKQRLEIGQNVLFCGTPCQIAGLKAYLGIDYPNLLTIDFICHGVPSPKIWKKYLQFREYYANSKVKKVSFRSKKQDGDVIRL